MYNIKVYLLQIIILILMYLKNTLHDTITKTCKRFWCVIIISLKL